ncbi:MAG: hypothetical protein ACK4QW_05780 [Alphaproteobacteria bacterium]
MTAAAADGGAGAVSRPLAGMVALLAVVFHLFCLFPYLAPLPLPTDTQPYALMAAGAALLLLGRRAAMPAAILALLLPVAIAFLLLPADAGNFTAWRSAVAYLSLFVVAAATVLLARGGHALSDRLLAAAVYVWFAVGLVQAAADRRFFTGLVSEARTTLDRGVTALATEPSHYATVASFLLLLLFMRGRERSLAGFLCLVQIVFLAQSAQVALLLAVAVAVYGIVMARPAFFLAGLLAPLALLAAWSLGIALQAGGVRILELLMLLMDDPALLVLADPSGNQRLAAIFFAFKGFLDHAFLPGGLADFGAYMGEQIRGGAWPLFFTDPTERILSGYGAALYELGLFGLTVPLVAGLGLFRYFRGSARHALVASALLHPLMLTAVPLALPLVGLTIGLCYGPRRYRGRDEAPEEPGAARVPAPL